MSNSTILRQASSRASRLNGGVPGQKNACPTPGYPDDPDVRTLIAELQRDSEHIRDWWPRHDVAAIGGSGSKKLRHPRLGPAEYSHVILQVADHPDQTLVTYSPVTPLESGR